MISLESKLWIFCKTCEHILTITGPSLNKWSGYLRVIYQLSFQLVQAIYCVTVEGSHAWPWLIYSCSMNSKHTSCPVNYACQTMKNNVLWTQMNTQLMFYIKPNKQLVKLGKYYQISIFAVHNLPRNTAKIEPCENFPFYGNLWSVTYTRVTRNSNEISITQLK